jgi:DNA topoisomerase VI subunit B
MISAGRHIVRAVAAAAVGKAVGFAAITTAPGTPAPAPEEIKDIAGPVDVWPYPMWMMLTAAALALAVLGVVAWLVVRWLRARPAPPPPTPRSIALRELEKLRTQVNAADPYAFSFPVSDVLRSYIGAQYRLHAREQTSPEFLAAISRSPKFSDADRSLLAGFLEHCDMIKFARIDATASDSAKLLDSAIAFVEGGRA